MKKILFLFFIVISTNIFAQTVGNEVKVYTPAHEEFTLYVNGKAINKTPSDVVQLKQVFVNSLNIKIEFSDTTIQSIEQKHLPIMNASPDDMTCPYKTVYKIIKKKKSYILVVQKMECVYALPKRYEP